MLGSGMDTNTGYFDKIIAIGQTQTGQSAAIGVVDRYDQPIFAWLFGRG